MTHLVLARHGKVKYKIKEFAEIELRLRTGYSPRGIRRKLLKALVELEAKGYLLIGH